MDANQVISYKLMGRNHFPLKVDTCPVCAAWLRLWQTDSLGVCI